MRENNKTYILFIKNDRVLSLHIGRTLSCTFPPGKYIYIGSAKRSIEKRISRHLSQEKRLHWHIDYFLQHTEITDVYIGPVEEKEMVSLILKKDIKIPCHGFGASDSPHPAHLFLIEDEESLIALLTSMGFIRF